MEKRCSIFLSRSVRGSCPYRKNIQKKCNLNLQFGREFLHFRARDFVTKFPLRNSKFLSNRNRIFLECRPANLCCCRTNQKAFFMTKVLFRNPKFLTSRGSRRLRSPWNVAQLNSGHPHQNHRPFFVTKLHFRDARFFFIRAFLATVFFLEFSPAESSSSPPKT